MTIEVFYLIVKVLRLQSLYSIEDSVHIQFWLSWLEPTQREMAWVICIDFHIAGKDLRPYSYPLIFYWFESVFLRADWMLVSPKVLFYQCFASFVKSLLFFFEEIRIFHHGEIDFLGGDLVFMFILFQLTGVLGFWVHYLGINRTWSFMVLL